MPRRTRNIRDVFTQIAAMQVSEQDQARMLHALLVGANATVGLLRERVGPYTASTELEELERELSGAVEDKTPVQETAPEAPQIPEPVDVGADL